jgi:hypothetical protein
MGNHETLAALYGIRSNPMYQAAEAMRRKTTGGAAAKANSSPESEERRSIQVLISTWETIAQILKDTDSGDSLYHLLPVSFMYRALYPGIEILRDETDSSYGEGFEALYNEYEIWAKSKDDNYHSPTTGGVHAHFG